MTRTAQKRWRATSEQSTGSSRLHVVLGNPEVLLGAILTICLCFCGICSWIILDARRVAWNQAILNGSALASAAAADIARNVETLSLSLDGVRENLKLPDIDQVAPERRQLILFDRSATARHLSSILVIRADGTIRFDSRTTFPSPLNLSDRDYFQIHKNDESVALYIGRPIRSRLTGLGVLTFSRRLTQPDGSFAGVVLGSIKLSYFEDLFKTSSLGPHASVTLARTDGIVLLRSPDSSEFIERDSQPAKIIDQFTEESAGSFETTATTDGRRRLFSFSRVGDLPLLVATGQDSEDIYAQWRPQAYAVGGLIAALIGLTFALLEIDGVFLPELGATFVAKYDAHLDLVICALFVRKRPVSRRQPARLRFGRAAGRRRRAQIEINSSVNKRRCSLRRVASLYP